MSHLDEMIDAGLLTRRAWTQTDAQGRETVCLLAALSPEVRLAKSPRACPADVMPQWLAYLTPWIDDAGTEDQWPLVLRRYAGLVSRWSVLTPVDWHRLDYTCRRLAVEEATRHCNAEQFPKVVAAVQTLIALCRRAENGDNPLDEEWKSAAAEWAAWVAGGASWAPEAASWASWAAARAAWAATREAAEAGAGEAGDRLICTILAAIGEKITEAEARV